MHPGSAALTTARFERFCQYYQVKRNGAEAARKAGYSANSARQQAVDLLARPDIKSRVAYLEAVRLHEAGMDAAEVIKRLVSITRADPNELIQNRVGSCRYCNGRKHEYQWRNKREFDAAKADWAKKPEKYRKDNKHETPVNKGGYGFRRTNPAHPDCPQCDGLGTTFTVPMDTTQLSPLARLLYAGVKETQHGVEIKTHDQMAALKMLAEITKAGVGNGDATNDLAQAIREINGSRSAAPIQTMKDETPSEPQGRSIQ